VDPAGAAMNRFVEGGQTLGGLEEISSEGKRGGAVRWAPELAMAMGSRVAPMSASSSGGKLSEGRHGGDAFVAQRHHTIHSGPLPCQRSSEMAQKQT
jgi:hypothetical protein